MTNIGLIEKKVEDKKNKKDSRESLWKKIKAGLVAAGLFTATAGAIYLSYKSNPRRNIDSAMKLYHEIADEMKDKCQDNLNENLPECKDLKRSILNTHKLIQKHCENKQGDLIYGNRLFKSDTLLTRDANFSEIKDLKVIARCDTKDK